MTQAHATHSHSSDDHGHGDEPHVLPLQVYLGVWGALMVLTILTVAVSRFDFGSANTFVALIVATIKGSLVVGFFMHLRYDKLFHSIMIAGGILAAALFVGFALMDSNQYQSTIIWDPNSPPPAPIGPPPVP